MCGVECVKRAGAEEAHGASDLLGQDLNCAVDSGSPAGHETVEVGASDQGEACSEGDGRHDVGTVHDAGVQMDLSVPADLAYDTREQPERHGSPVELPTTMV